MNRSLKRRHKKSEAGKTPEEKSNLGANGNDFREEGTTNGESPVKEELESSHVFYQLHVIYVRGDCPEFIIELSPHARHCVMHCTYS